MTTKRLRRGSALLIVLGMMSFMLFSGLAFAVFMRYSRLPTSFLRRTTTTRQLAKAALAEAIEEIDIAIGNDPHPGVSPNGYTSGVISNVWHHRVFFGVGLNGGTEKRITPISNAPSVLTLEGLAYLPPNLINDVRYYSRCTPTAEWQPFWFDSGRYAYVAVDVSDYFDVNRLLANERRAASASQRITLAHLFEKIERTTDDDGEEIDEHTGAGSGAKEWDQFIDETCGENEPFISLADFNIAWGTGSKSFGGQSVANPFRTFVETGRAYGEMTAADPKAEYYRQLTFVTDSWSPTPKRTDGIKVADLEDATYQPFKQSDLESKSSVSLVDLADNTSSMMSDRKLLQSTDYLGERLCALTRIALWDYLDEDKQPLSLAVPTCERVPMICGIHPEFSGSFKVEEQNGEDYGIEPITEGETEYEWVKRDVTYSMSFEGVGSDLSGFVSWTYPFLLRGSEASDKFKADGRVAVFLTASGTDLSARPGHEIKGLFWDSAEKDGAKKSVTETAAIYPFAISEDSSSYASADDGAVAMKDLQFKAENCNASEKKPMVTVTLRWKRPAGSKTGPNYVASEILKEGGIKQPEGEGGLFGLLKSDGTRDTDFEFLKNEGEGGIKKAKVNVAIWARVTDEEKNTVDLVPACLMDDGNLNGVDNTGMDTKLGDGHDPYPLLKITAEGEIVFSLEKFHKGDLGSYTVTKQALLTGDPRFNHAPENWQIVSDVSGALSTTWYGREKEQAKNTGCDGDLYMATSDQGYLQSIYELMMLPRIQDAGIKKAGIGDGFRGSYDTTAFDGVIRSDRKKLKDSDFMWRTYRPEDFDEIDDGRIVAGDSGPKVNPYSDSTNVLMAAFANTPHDWRVASTNNEDVTGEADEFNKAHAWNGYSSPKLCWGCLTEVAGAFSQKARESGDWETAFRELNWNDTGASEEKDRTKMLAGVELDNDDGPLYSVDKKYLYGFWHDSFAARQQLFLVFVRAEPMMMGGGVEGQAPPQLGARAVALVWREPSVFKDSQGSKRDDAKNSTVHRTRILFYHQFD